MLKHIVQAGAVKTSNKEPQHIQDIYHDDTKTREGEPGRERLNTFWILLLPHRGQQHPLRACLEQRNPKHRNREKNPTFQTETKAVLI